jgi:uncharacterized membrane protein (UPF0136 family)
MESKSALLYNFLLNPKVQRRNRIMKVTATIVFVYGLIIAFGGIMGYVKGGSHVSLILGSLFGVALLICAYFISKKHLAAQYISLALTFALDGIFTYRFAKTLHFFPAGFLSLASLAVLIILALKIRRTVKPR